MTARWDYVIDGTLGAASGGAIGAAATVVGSAAVLGAAPAVGALAAVTTLGAGIGAVLVTARRVRRQASASVVEREQKRRTPATAR